MKATIGSPKKIQLLNKYDGGYQSKCTAEVVDISVDPPELGTIVGTADGQVFTGSKLGTGKLRAQFIFSDGTTNTDEVSIDVFEPSVKEIEVPVKPKLIGGAILDLD